MPPTPFQFGFLNQALQDFINAIQNDWSANFLTVGIEILLGLGAIAFAVYAIQLLITGDIHQFIMGFALTVLSLALLYGVFLNAQELATEVYTGFETWAQQLTGLSPATLSPSGVMESGLQLARVFWAAAGAASWFHEPFSALVTTFCTIVMILGFAVAAVILLLAQVQAWALIVGGLVLLAFAALPWTWHLFPGWGISVLSICIKIFFIFAILEVGLTEAQGWAATMSGAAATIVEDASLSFEAMIESLLFLGLVYYIPNLMAGLVLGAASSVMNAGEAIIGGMAGAGAAAAGGLAMAAATPGNIRATAGMVAQGARATVNAMLLR
jgi:P-type conjugative transfer protein TrbL